MTNFLQAIRSFVAWEWISSVTKSLFKLASYIVELPMVAAGVYIMIATGIPGANNAGWYNFAFGVLLSAPEVLAPGAFFRAETMQSRGRTRAAKVTRWIASAMLFFAAVTFSSVMIFHFPEQWLQAIMFCRVMTALGYSIITRIDMDGDVQPALPPAQSSSAVDSFDSWPLVGMVALLQQQMAELASKQQVNLVDLQVQRLLSEVQHLQSEPAPEIDYDVITHCVMTRLQAQFDARQNVQIEAVQEDVTHQIDAPKPRQKPASARKNDAAKKTLTMRQPSASKTDKKSVIHSLLLQDLSLSSYYLAGQAHCSEATARRIKNEFIDARHDAGQNDAVNTPVLTHDALRQDA